ncbi:hypothetical protein QMT33_003446 [Vibrio alginolyticus]|nr:hypothetical protein [Vibrio alginolyticus]
MDSVILQLKKDFYSQIRALQSPNLPQVTSTLAVLTDEFNPRTRSSLD